MVSNFWKCAILAQAFTSFTLAERVLIGFRVVSSDEAQKINEKSNIFRDPDYDDWAESRGSTQIGRGVYLAGSPTGWEGGYGDWYCYVKADEDRLRRAPKVWIPAVSLAGTRLWGASESTILSYVEAQIDSGEDADDALRLSLIQFSEPAEQLLIPTSVVRSDGLDFYARCFASQWELSQHYWEVVRYDNWPNQSGRKN